MSEETTQLAYAPQVPFHRRKSFAKWLLIAVFVAMVPMLFKWGPIVLARIQLNYWQQECLNYIPSDRLVTFDETWERSQTFSGEGAFHVHPHAPKAWLQFSERLGLIQQGPPGICFLGQRQAKTGKSRLISVSASTFYSPPFYSHSATGYNFPELALQSRVFTVGSLFESPTEVLNSNYLNQDVKWDALPGDRIVIFVGHADPDDASHFTIDFEKNGVPGVIDGWLRDDDTVVLGERRMTTPPPPTSRGSPP